VVGYDWYYGVLWVILGNFECGGGMRGDNNVMVMNVCR
jgi:hypothetical protein